jgi:hypothetical protein
MTNFNESKLSKVLARRVIVPEDRSQLLPLSTPIYCPTHNGVRAARVTIINPQSNSFYTDNSIADTVMIGCQYKKVAAAANSDINVIGTPTVTDDGLYLGDDQNHYEVAYGKTCTFIYLNVTTGAKIGAMQSGTTYPALTSPYTCSKLQLDMTATGAVTLTNLDTGATTSKGSIASGKIIFVSGPAYIDLNVSTVNGKPALGTPEHLEAVTNPNSVKNTVDIDLSKTLNLKYFVPHEVDLETDVDLMDIIKSDFAVKFKHSVSSNIMSQIAALKAANRVTTIDHGETLPETLGKVLTDYIHNGTGQRFSIYKYDNGAPIEYISTSAQPEIDDIIKTDDQYQYASINQRNIPGLYYFENPSLVLPEATLQQYQTGLVNGTIKDYVERKLNVDSAEIGFTTIGEGIFGTNDCFAVAFTEPSIKIADSTDFYGKEICVTVNYGVLLVNQTNLRVII